MISEFSICFCNNPLWAIFLCHLCIELTVSHFLFCPYSIHGVFMSYIPQTDIQSNDELLSLIVRHPVPFIFPFPFLLACSRLSVPGDERKRGRTKARSGVRFLPPLFALVLPRFFLARFRSSLTTESLEQATFL